jgi:PncC family amidohydrolase
MRNNWRPQLEEALEKAIGKILTKKCLKLAIAESCTGGLIGHRITNIPGSSDYYLGSVTAYAYEIKQRLLGVKQETLIEFGAVSRETVIEMAHGIRTCLKADFPMEDTIGLSVSGIAGPGGGMPGKPVGLVWVGLSAKQGDHAWKFLWKGSRIENKEYSAQAALQILWDFLNDNLPPEPE